MYLECRAWDEAKGYVEELFSSQPTPWCSELQSQPLLLLLLLLQLQVFNLETLATPHNPLRGLARRAGPRRPQQHSALVPTASMAAVPNLVL